MGVLFCNKLLLGSNKTLQFVKMDDRDRTRTPDGQDLLDEF